MIPMTFAVNYSGYIPVLRSILLLVNSGVIPLSLLGSYIYFVMQADFDTRHKYYSVVLRDDEQLANAANVNPTTIYRHRKELIKAGLLLEEGKYTKVTNFGLFDFEVVKKLVKLPPANPQELFLIPQEILSNKGIFIANMQKGPGY